MQWLEGNFTASCQHILGQTSFRLLRGMLNTDVDRHTKALLQVEFGSNPKRFTLCDLLDVEQGAGFGFCVGLGIFVGNFKAISAGYCERL